MWGLGVMLALISCNLIAGSKNTDCVIILHGLGRSAWSMISINDALQNEGYTVWNKTYPSRSASIEVLASTHIQKGINHCRKKQTERIHFVTHSMGGILIRQFLSETVIEELGNIVMISPPNKGSEIIDEFMHFALFRWVIGPAGLQLGVGDKSVPRHLSPILPTTVGVITGNVSKDPWFSEYLPGEDDGKVTVESAKLSKMADFRVYPLSHTYIIHNASVVSDVIEFIHFGHFTKE